jgi:crotonobetainyl-CoA:carnitine CoA-transferase CaiB-like acyl-CoA transferase
VAQRTGTAPRRPGARAEWPVLACADGHVAVVHRTQEWARLMDLVADPVLREERFQTLAGRRAHRADLNAILARYFVRLTRAEIHALSLRHKLPFGPVWSPDEVRADPQMTARGMFHTVDWADRAMQLPRVPVLWRGVAP